MKQINPLCFLVMLMVTIWSCSQESGMRENPFGEGGKPVLDVKYESNADSVFLSWKLVEDVKYDRIEVSDQYGRNHQILGKDENRCTVTNIPYNRSVIVKLSLISGAETVSTVDVPVSIDGVDHYIASMIIPDRGSVTEGDGMYSVDLQDGRSIFLMGDSYMGEVSNGSRISGNHMYRNTYSVYDHETGKSVGLCDVKGENTSAVVPSGEIDEDQHWYWPGHGLVVGNKLYVFQFLMYKGEGAEGWNFYYDQTHIVEYGLPDLNLEKAKISSIPFHAMAPVVPTPENPIIHFGAAALNDLEQTGYLYIYAQVDLDNSLPPKTAVYVARTTPQNLYTSWEYFNGANWVKDQQQLASLEGLEALPVSSQFNVFKLGEKYILLTQNKTWNTGEIYTFVSSTPWGPWENQKLVYEIPEMSNSNWFTYNAMAHPQFEKDGMILITYNVNTSKLLEHQTDVESYRPRFIWIKKDEILK